MAKYYSVQEKIYRRLLLLRANDEFMKDVSAIREKIKEFGVKNDFSDDGEEIEVDYSMMPEFYEDIEKLRRKFNLSGIYDMPLQYYVQGFKGELYTSDLPMHPVPQLIPEFDWLPVVVNETGDEEIVRARLFPEQGWEDREHVMVELFPETTLKDFVNNWDRISKKRDELFGVMSEKSKRTDRSENLERDLYIYRLKKQGKKCMEISRMIGISYQDVSKVIKRLKERAKRNMPNKET